MGSFLLKTVDALVRAARWAATVVLIGAVILNFANIIGRYFLSAPIEWAEEVMLFLMVGIVFLAAVPVAREGRHIKMDIIVNQLPPGGRRAFEILGGLIELVVALIIVWIGVPVIEQLYAFDQRSEAANMPLWIPQAIVPVGLLLVAVAAAARLVTATGAPHDAPTVAEHRPPEP
jgi:TRAP-type C4-dicarboxylate transport system permease small subunit